MSRKLRVSFRNGFTWFTYDDGLRFFADDESKMVRVSSIDPLPDQRIGFVINWDTRLVQEFPELANRTEYPSRQAALEAEKGVVDLMQQSEKGLAALSRLFNE